MAATISGDGTSTLINLTTSGNTVLGDASTDTLNVGNGGLVKNASGNVGIGTASPTVKLDVRGNGLKIYDSGSTTANLQVRNSTTGDAAGFTLQQDGVNTLFYNNSNGASVFATNGTERMRIDTSGNLLMGTTSVIQAGAICNKYDGQTRNGIMLQTTFASAGTGFIRFLNSSETKQGEISANTTTTVAYGTSSDYRLKNTIAPMTGALAKVSLLKPCTYKWNADGSDGQGFIAHELQEVCPDAVIGEKDAVNEDGSIDPQGIDTSFLVATLTAAIQELKAIVDAQAVEIAALKGTA